MSNPSKTIDVEPGTLKRSGHQSHFISAEKALSSSDLISITQPESWHQYLVPIVDDTAWLMGDRGPIPNSQLIRQHYLQLLRERGLVTSMSEFTVDGLVMN